MKHTEEQIRAALLQHFEHIKEATKLPALWTVTFPVNFRSLAMMDHKYLKAWFCGFAAATKLGMWWTLESRGKSSGGSLSKFLNE